MPLSLRSRTLSIESEAIPLFLGAPALEPVRLSGHEGINSLFAYELLLKTLDGLNLGASEAADFDLDAFIGREISCTIQLDGAGSFIPGAVGAALDHIGAGTREINAFITDAALWGEEGRHLQYRLSNGTVFAVPVLTQGMEPDAAKAAHDEHKLSNQGWRADGAATPGRRTQKRRGYGGNNSQGERS
jgi:uncharacterized protein involved in type VI secretion and phage assembly